MIHIYQSVFSSRSVILDCFNQKQLLSYECLLVLNYKFFLIINFKQICNDIHNVIYINEAKVYVCVSVVFSMFHSLKCFKIWHKVSECHLKSKIVIFNLWRKKATPSLDSVVMKKCQQLICQFEEYFSRNVLK